MEFLVRGIPDYEEPGVCMAFEESTEESTQSVRSLGFDLNKLVRKKNSSLISSASRKAKLRKPVNTTSKGLFIRLNAAIESIGAKRVALDNIEALFSGLQNEGILRAELRCLFRC